MEWDPTQFFRQDGAPPAPFALIVLNQPINERAYDVLSKHACTTICVDGGANHFYKMKKHHGKESTELPSLIIGDLDSIHPTTRAFYQSLNVRIIEDHDQYTTDFTKCLNYLNKHSPELTASAASSTNTPSPLTRLEILILGGLGGRVDQAFSQIHHLYLMAQQREQQRQSIPGDLYLISEESITFILAAGENTIRTPGVNRPGCDGDGGYLLEENVGIIPFLGPSSITTNGFQWDVTDWPTEIGGQLSTSNHIRADVVSVEAKGPILFTLELAMRFKRAR